MTRAKRLRRAAVVVTGAALVLIALLLVWAVTDTEIDAGGIVFAAVIVALIAGAGYFTWRVPDHLVPWLLLGIVAGVGTGQIALTIHEETEGIRRLTTGALSFGGWWPSIVLAVVLLPLLFPTGRPPTRRWWWVAWAGGIAVTGLATWYAVAVARDCITCSALGIGWLDAVYSASIGLVGLGAVGSVLSLAVRYRRSAGTERKQLQWLLFPMSVGLIGLLLILVRDSALAGLLFTFGALGIPVGIVVAVTRHRLYDIDQVITRTISYATVIGALSLLFAAGAIWLPQLLTGTSNNLAVAGSTLAVAALFNPMRKRVTRAVDRRFHRLPYEADELVGELRRRLRGQTDILEVAATFASTSAAALSPAVTAVWLRESA